MAQPEIPGNGIGIPRMPYGFDGSDWIALLVSTLGLLQVDVISSAIPSDAATQTTLASTLTALQSIQNLVGALHDVGLDELDVRVEGFDPVPSSPINAYTGGVAVSSGSWVLVVTHTVTLNTTFYLTDVLVVEETGATGVDNQVIINLNDTTKLQYRQKAAQQKPLHFNTPLVVASEGTVKLYVKQWSGGSLTYCGNVIGFEV